MRLIQLFRIVDLLLLFFFDFFWWLLAEDAVEALDFMLINRIAARYLLDETDHRTITIHVKVVIVARLDAQEDLLGLGVGGRVEDLLFEVAYVFGGRLDLILHISHKSQPVFKLNEE